MDLTIVKNFLRLRLDTTEKMQTAANHIEVSLATLYRYKADPYGMPLGKMIALGEFLGFPIAGSAAWSKKDVISGERRRYELEEMVARHQGRRYIVSPSFSVTCEIPEFTRALWNLDYGSRTLDLLPAYSELRSQRNHLYLSGQYQSFEIWNGHGYRDFFNCKGRFEGLTRELRDKQLQEILRSLHFPHVHRRIYLQQTPELPIFSSYTPDMVVIRVDDFTVEFNDSSVAAELNEIFNDYYDNADIKTIDDASQFLNHPI